MYIFLNINSILENKKLNFYHIVKSKQNITFKLCSSLSYRSNSIFQSHANKLIRIVSVLIQHTPFTFTFTESVFQVKLHISISVLIIHCILYCDFLVLFEYHFSLSSSL